MSDFFTEVSRGTYPRMSAVNKFGEAPDGIQTTLTDIWDRANATPTQQIWIAPTTARQHNLVSTSANDDGSPAGTGARTVTVRGLTSWSTAEVSETVTLDGITNVLTTNSYVIIHMLEVATFGAAGPNVGTITATAVTDGTITAVILPGLGQSQMAIYGIPSTQTLYVNDVHCSINKSAGSPSAAFQLLVAIDPANFPAVFIQREVFGLSTSGTSALPERIIPPIKIAGPAIVKVSAIASAADVDGSAQVNGVLIDN